MARLWQKISKFDAAVDRDEKGGVNILDDEEAAREVPIKALVPEIPEESLNIPIHPGPYPLLPSKGKASVTSELSSALGKVSISGDEYHMAPGTPNVTPSKQLKIWDSGKTSELLFGKEKAKAKAPSSVFSIETHDSQMEIQLGINIMSSRFWDPISDDWNPERFLNPLTQQYACPFNCE